MEGTGAPETQYFDHVSACFVICRALRDSALAQAPAALLSWTLGAAMEQHLSMLTP
jgi:hypothetical protein